MRLKDAIEQLESGDLTAVQLMEDVLAARRDHEDLNAYLATREPDVLLGQAEAADRRRGEAQEVGPLEGVPVAIKDNICTEDLPTTAGSRMLEDFESPYEATVVERLREAGAIVVGKTNLDEFGMGSSNENSHFGPVRNPVDSERVPGGSSGGSAAAVASGQCAAALGSDTGGSVRQPAAHCGVVGVKPTYGRVSRWGLIAFASSLDQIGPLTQTVEGSARMLEVIAGHDRRDATSVDEAVGDYVDAADEGVEGMTIGWPEQFFEGRGDLDEEVAARVDETFDALEEAGAEVVDISLPHADYAVATYYLIATAEASSNLARYDGVRYGHRAEAEDLQEMYEKSRAEGFGDEVKRRIMLGTYVLSAGFYDEYYAKAQKVRTLIKRDFERAYRRCDAIVAPTTPTPAFELGDKAGDPLQMYMADVFTTAANLAGIPAMSVPCGETGEGLPVGVQVMAPAFGEETMFRVGGAVEKA